MSTADWVDATPGTVSAGLSTEVGNNERNAGEQRPECRGRDAMLFILALILFVAWLLGMVGTYTIGAFVHVLLVIALVLLIVGLLTGRRTIV